MMERTDAVFDGAPGVRLVADTFGDPDAPPVLMLHGGGQTRHAWDRTAIGLASSGWRAITIDLRGHGESTHPQPPAYGLEDFAADVRAVIAAIPRRPLVIGASLGGIAALLAVTEPPTACVTGLVLVDVAHRFQARGGSRIVSFMEEHPDGFASLADAARAIDAYLPRRARPRDISGLRHNLRHSGGRWTWHWNQGVLDEARRLMQDQAQIAGRLAKAATCLREPCLLVRGAESDVLTPSIAAEFIGLVETATMAEVPHAGHMVAGDNNDAFTAAIHDWLETFASSDSTRAARRTAGSD